jgi:hypothetical protein
MDEAHQALCRPGDSYGAAVSYHFRARLAQDRSLAAEAAIAARSGLEIHWRHGDARGAIDCLTILAGEASAA